MAYKTDVVWAQRLDLEKFTQSEEHLSGRDEFSLVELEVADSLMIAYLVNNSC